MMVKVNNYEGLSPKTQSFFETSWNPIGLASCFCENVFLLSSFTAFTTPVTTTKEYGCHLSNVDKFE